MNLLTFKISKKQSGFTLIEIMVGLVIGLIASLVIMQVFSVFEGQKRTTTGSADAQTNGSIALFNIQRQVQSAGFGLPIFDGDIEALGGSVTAQNASASAASNNTALNCDTTLKIENEDSITTPKATVDMTPIEVADGGTANSDSLTIRYAGNNISNGTGGVATNVKGLQGNIIQVDNNLGCVTGDTVVYVNANTCASAKVASTNANIDADSIHLTLSESAGANQISKMVTGGRLTCIGQFHEKTFSINANNELSINGSPVISEIVEMQIQYGIANTKTSSATTWVNASGPWAPPLTVTKRNQIRAIRLAVVARNNLLEKTNVNPNGLISWASTPTSTAPPLNILNTQDWNRYRYRVYETIIPVRNIAYSRALT
jgi:type IV pilus assembly protein PilW